MTDLFIHDTAVIRDSRMGKVKAFRNAFITGSILADGCSVGDNIRSLLTKKVVDFL